MTNGTNSYQVLSRGSEFQWLDGRDAQSDNVAAAKALSKAIKTTLGPKGLDKLLISSDGTIVVTNDGASIVDRMDISHPAARSIVEIAAQQNSQVGDGTTSALVLVGELLEEAESLLEMGLHETTIARGYTLAAERARETLRERAIPVDPDDRSRLRTVARTSVTGKWDRQASEFLAEKTVDAVQSIEQDGTVDLKRITRKAIPGRSYYDSAVVEGLVIDMESSSTTPVSPELGLPDVFESATVALVDDQLTIETATGQGAVTLESPADLRDLKAYEREVYEGYVDRITDAGADVLFCQQSIDDMIQYLLTKAGVLAVERTRRDELEKVGRATGANPVGPVDDLTAADTGLAQRVERRDLGPTEVAIVDGGTGGDQVSLLLRGGTQQVADETKRVVDGCFHVLARAIEDGVVVPGGGATEIHLARDLRKSASNVPGKKQLAVEAFADALEEIPRTLAASAGMSPIDVVVELRARHHDGDHATGLRLEEESGRIGDVVEGGILEPLAVTERAITSATEAANLLVRVDEVVAVSHEEDAGEHDHDHEHGPGGVVESTDGYPWAVGHSMGH
ncbi:thermosome subunit alpha [Natrialbaceae archaeon AArc-T1-2]|uniref:thermosome subunit alpha n=1 Tax=Natrialbaceae archaeon AArc-T1-2 TaxID=3053904 RepID=UPI00255B27F2|nr:thermosome subunit alpha [Natrialbaceae archaeon AArc-T1-2]WIV68805.1 thermosome subunit alpha [Natrialbaceae archaeon AArc-T1-2]